MADLRVCLRFGCSVTGGDAPAYKLQARSHEYQTDDEPTLLELRL